MSGNLLMNLVFIYIYIYIWNKIMETNPGKWRKLKDKCKSDEFIVEERRH